MKLMVMIVMVSDGDYDDDDDDDEGDENDDADDDGDVRFYIGCFRLCQERSRKTGPLTIGAPRGEAGVGPLIPSSTKRSAPAEVLGETSCRVNRRSIFSSLAISQRHTAHRTFRPDGCSQNPSFPCKGKCFPRDSSEPACKGNLTHPLPEGPPLCGGEPNAHSLPAEVLGRTGHISSCRLSPH